MPRRAAHLANLDLNLLVALRELVRERSVTRATERLGITQPGGSAALSRLRRHFGDELLVRDRGEDTLTALGAQLAEQVGTDRIALMQERLAVPLARRMDLRVLNWRVPSGRTFATTPTVYPL
jgi:hypothetical protein